MFSDVFSQLEVKEVIRGEILLETASAKVIFGGRQKELSQF